MSVTLLTRVVTVTELTGSSAIGSILVRTPVAGSNDTPPCGRRPATIGDQAARRSEPVDPSREGAAASDSESILPISDPAQRSLTGYRRLP